MLTTIAIVFVVSSFIASVLAVAATMLSSRISQKENLVEVYNIADESPQISPNAYSLES